MSTTLQQHGRSIAGGFSPPMAASEATHRQGADCGELVSKTPKDEEDKVDEEPGLLERPLVLAGAAFSTLAFLVLLVGLAVGSGGG